MRRPDARCCPSCGRRASPGVVIAVLVLFFVFAHFVGDAEEPPGTRVTLLLLGLSAGYLIGWRWPFFGGVLGLACGIGFYGGRFLIGGPFLMIQMLLLLPGVLFVIYGLLTLRRRRGAS